MGDSDDDYMSNEFLSKIEDVKPGTAKSREHRRQLRIYANSEASFKQAPKRDMEAQRRLEALNTPVPETNKGFGLLAKMGYKPGMAIGKTDEASASSIRLTEPIDLKVKLSRTGLGHEKVQEERQQERCEAYLKNMQMQARMSDTLATDFRKRKRNYALQRLIIADIMKSRKACQDLDMRSGIEQPTEKYLWPVNRVQEEIDVHTDQLENKRFRPTEAVVWKYFYSNGAEAPEEEDLAELSETALYERLERVTRYVRARHFYCVWCGTTFGSEHELEEECPGPSKDDHE